MVLKKKQQTALIVGSGVIGAYLSQFLLKKGIKIIVATRKLKKYVTNYKRLKINNKVKFVKLNLLNKKKIKYIILKYKPNFIYYLAGQRSILKSFKNPADTYISNYLGAKNYLDILRKEKSSIKFFKANSGYIFNGEKKKITLKSKLIIDTEGLIYVSSCANADKKNIMQKRRGNDFIGFILSLFWLKRG